MDDCGTGSEAKAMAKRNRRRTKKKAKQLACKLRAAKEESGNASAVEYPPVTINEYGLIAPYLPRWPLEDDDKADDSIYFSDDDMPANIQGAHEVTKRFLKQVRESRGYDVDCFPPMCISSPFIPRLLSNKKLHARATVVANFAIDHINTETVDKVGKRYHFQSVEKVVETRTLMMLLTLNVKEVDAVADVDVDDTNAPIKTVQAMVWAPYHADLEFMEWRFKLGCA